MKLEIKRITLPSQVRNLGERFALYFFPAVAVLVILILLLVIVRPRIGAIFALRKKISQSQQHVSALNNKLATLQGLNYDLLLSDVKKVEISLPSEKDLPSLLSNLESLASETGVNIAAIQLTPGAISPETTKTDSSESLLVKITISGDFFQIKNFFSKITTASRAMTVRSLSLGLSAVGPQASLSATLNLDAYFQPLATTKFTVAEPLQTLTSEEQKVLSGIRPAPIVTTPTPLRPPTGKADPFAPF